MMSVSRETIYTWNLRLSEKVGRACQDCLAYRPRAAETRGRNKSLGAKMVGMSPMEDRYAEVTGREVPGHSEDDLVIGKAGKSAMGTWSSGSVDACVRRPARGHDADSVKDALFNVVKDLPAHLSKSLTWDHGTKMVRHAALTLAADSRCLSPYALSRGGAAPAGRPAT